MFNRKKVKKFSIAILIAGGIFAFFQFAFAQDTTEGAYETDSTSGSDTTEIPPPPGSVEVLREGDITFVLFDAGEYYSDVYAYHIYRRCGDSTWWSLNKVMVSDCSGSTCSYPVFDKPDTDTCEYAVSIINSAGIEGDKSPGERPVVSDTSEDTTTTNTDGTGGADDTSDITTDITTEEDPKDTTSDDIIYQEVSGKHIIYLSVDYADQVEWTMFPGGSETETYLGAAVFNKERGLWEYMWDTTKVPNGDYVLVPKIISTTGSKYKDTPTYVRVKNDVVVNETTTKEEDTLISIIEAAAEELDKVVEESGGEEEVAKEDVVKVLSPYIDKIQEYIDEKGEEAVKREVLAESEKAEEELRVLLNIESSKLLYSLDGDEEEFKRFENKVIIAAQKSIEEVGLIAK
ncbi:MAG: hypothetical protein KAI72_09275, partial [Candidatus Pacebacteria bacterium]|nr:hypothetical protein [Candidatus Paceibacterota bacterium]